MMNRIALSWSGGKDSCMALHELTGQGDEVACLVTTIPQETGKTFAHNEDIKNIQAQADSIGIPLELVQCTYGTYSEDFLEKLKRLKVEYSLDSIAFGDMYLEGHREWGQKLAYAAGLKATYPLWTKKTEMLKALRKFVNSGYKAEVIKVREDLLPADWVGRPLDETFIEDICKKAVCPMGESGEYHTFVYDGPLFKKMITLNPSK